MTAVKFVEPKTRLCKSANYPKIKSCGIETNNITANVKDVGIRIQLENCLIESCRNHLHPDTKAMTCQLVS